MATTADALLAAVRADPDADLPRLVYADHLDDTGDVDRAEFIRVQCELARLDEWDDRQLFLCCAFDSGKRAESRQGAGVDWIGSR